MSKSSKDAFIIESFDKVSIPFTYSQVRCFSDSLISRFFVAQEN